MLQNKRFITSDGRSIIPGYFTKEEREILREDMKSKGISLYCGCRSDNSLEYYISSDLKFYPAHHGYIHAKGCLRGMTISELRKDSGYLSNDDNDMIMAFLKFNPATFSVPFDHKNAGTSVSLPDVEEEQKDIMLSLGDFVRAVNRDTFCERAYQNKAPLSKEYFLNYLKGRLRHICLHNMQKPLLSYNLKEDRMQFFYAPFAGVEIEQKEDRKIVKIKTKTTEDKVYTTFVPTKIWEKEVEKFFKRYGVNPELENTGSYSIYAAGFLYRMKSRKNPENEYTAVGRLHLFMVSEHGIYCGSMEERETLNWVAEFFRMFRKEPPLFYTPPEDKAVAGVFEKEGYKRGILLCEKSEEGYEDAVVRSVTKIQSEMDIAQMILDMEDI